MTVVIKMLNLNTGETSAEKCPSREAPERLAKLRKKRGHWKMNPVVHAIVTKEV